MKRYSAVIDIGSNTMRLVIYSHENYSRIQEVENVKIVARLRAYLDDDKRLTGEGQFILLDTLKSFQKVIDTYDIDHSFCAATAAIRQAKNHEEIEEKVKKETGMTMKVLSEEEEAYYGYLAVVNSTSVEEGFTIDIGGGSTEITYFKNRKLVFSHSFPFGSLTLMEFFDADKPSTKQVKRARTYIFDHLEELEWIKEKNIPIIGIGGSARNMVEIDQTFKDYPLAGLHEYEMFDTDIAHISEHLTTLNRKEREKIEGLSKDRADSILPAMQVFYCLYDLTEASSFVLSRKGLRDGLLYEQLTNEGEEHLYENVLDNSLNDLIEEYELSSMQVTYAKEMTRKLFEALVSQGASPYLTSKDWAMVERACMVYNLGSYIDSESSSQHSFYLLANRTIDGLMHVDRLKLALLASFKSKSVFKQFIRPYKNWFLKSERKKLQTLGSIIKLTYALDSTKRRIISDIDITVKKDVVRIRCFCTDDSKPEMYQAEKQKKHLEKALKMPIRISFQNQ
ncbi:Ppx/GppA family phosphatase [Salimicrobium halophilum]|uniref:Exopolyphosphatase / guanosine-5'-triphosphate,3'-diphosphate pyrophosphatase n=1 Tax=Salimicrobium halophilum TaxID=86666 RepID=A0A1G8UA05_9BACI|nr:Ppx/GppA family phosphatase [Salimicrobium halophilum]SDJ50626.1 exopolyphosphatase / guanosine-5'-triphosphate,3'-diphosphate pyrophosphatase [Salimicrobium halophilum]